MSPLLLSDMGALAIGSLSLPMLLAKATIVLVVALGITLAMQRASACARHLVWLVTLGTLLLVPALSAWAPLRLAILPAAPVVDGAWARDVGGKANLSAGQEQVLPSRSLPSSEAKGSLWTAQSAAAPASEASTPPSANATSGLFARIQGMSAISILLSLWAVVVLAIAGSLAWAALTVRGIVRRARPLDATSWRTPLWEVSDRFGLEEPPRLLQSDEAKMPFACGILRPTIVLPKECESWSLDRRHAVLLHELAHVRRHDLFGHTLGRLVCAVYWFHPLVWAAAKQLRSESERACDDLALACGTRATDYAEHLLDIVTSVRRDSTPSVALAMARRKEFEGRMLAILDPELRRSSPSRRQSAVLIASLTLVALVVGAATPAPRTANAAALDPTPEERYWRTVDPQEPATVKEARQAAAVKAHPDSGVPGVPSIVARSTSVSNPTSTSMPRSTSEATQAHAPTSVSQSANDLVSSVVSVASSATAEALKGLIKSGKGKGDQQGADDRPILLAKVLRTDSSTSLRRIAAWGLSEYADSPIAAEALATALRKDVDANVREMSAWALGHGDNGNAVALEALAAALHSDSDARVRTIAAWALGHIGDHASTDALSAALSDPSEDVRYRAVWALGNVGPKQAPKALLAKLSDKEPRMRELVAWALFRIEDPASIPALEAALKVEQNKEIQLADIKALAALGEKSVDALRGLLESPDPRIKAMAVRALAGGHAAGPWPWPWPEPRPFP
jgi:beta-lactamase regulating signal transducer with metallopeptidase domain/HEAT repeat protein